MERRDEDSGRVLREAQRGGGGGSGWASRWARLDGEEGWRGQIRTAVVFREEEKVLEAEGVSKKFFLQKIRESRNI